MSGPVGTGGTGAADGLADLRRTYRGAPLAPDDVDPDPLVQLGRWVGEARLALEGTVEEPNAMTLATVDPDGAPSARIVLLKGLDARGLTFFTDRRSRKAIALAANPLASVVLHWQALARQVRIEGSCVEIPRDASEAYFVTRPVGSRRGAWASHQSAPIADRDALEERVAEVGRRFPGDDVPLPEHWGGYRLDPELVELWQGRPDRLHDRVRYVRDGAAWRRDRLQP